MIYIRVLNYYTGCYYKYCIDDEKQFKKTMKKDREFDSDYDMYEEFLFEQGHRSTEISWMYSFDDTPDMDKLFFVNSKKLTITKI